MLDRMVAVRDGGIVIGGGWIVAGGGRVKNASYLVLRRSLVI